MRSRVVIADADELLSAVYRAFLAAEGYDAETVNNGLDCLQAMKKAETCMLVIDPEIPWGGGGIAALLGEDAELPAVPVLFLTRHLEAVTEASLPPSRYAILMKPVAPAMVCNIVRTLKARPAIREFCVGKGQPIGREAKKS
jgi:DNA-binding NtrC family response regulator